MSSPPSTHRFANALAAEASPYLRQHAHNPVDWRPWGPEAFAAARERQVPIFLSVGYSTCYWCHVMERESFEHEPTAALLNERFVPVKVDREERPDVDDIYMAAVQMMTGHGGWPMSVFLTAPGAGGEDDPGLKPFWGGTYFPREPRGAHPSFRQILEGLSEAWRDRRDDVLRQADAITDAIRAHLSAKSKPAQLTEQHVGAAVGRLMQMYDPAWGGFGGAPKFPQPVYLEFLLDALPAINEESARTALRAAIRTTLDRMALGGLFDQVGGGFHRYSVDAQWLVPHFEKMLYDNAQLVSIYARAARMFDDAFYARIARRTCEYVLREMTHQSLERQRGVGTAPVDAVVGDGGTTPDSSADGVDGRNAGSTDTGGFNGAGPTDFDELNDARSAFVGGFFSAQDAEVNHREGQNYLWRPDEMRAALDEADADFAIRVYGLDQGANFQDPHHLDEAPANVLRLKERPEALAASLGMTEADVLARLDDINAKLYAARAQREQPGLDDKVIASWNGLMVAALVEAGVATEEPRYVQAAQRAADFILTTMRDGAGGLVRIATATAKIEAIPTVGRATRPSSPTPAFLEDYAHVARGLLALHRAHPADGRYLAAARELVETARGRFGDRASGGWFDTLESQNDLIVRTQTTHDGALPSGQSVMIHNLLDLAALTGDEDFAHEAAAGLRAASRAIAETPLGPVESTRALLRVLRERPELLSLHGMGDDAEPVAPLAMSQADDDDAPAPERADEAPVQVYANVEEVTVKPGAPVELELALKIAPGWHINAHEPGVEGLTPLEVSIERGAGVRAVVAYPPGEPLRTDWALGEKRPLTYEDTVHLTVRLERTDEAWRGEPTLVVTFQAATETECAPAQRVTLGIRVTEEE